MGMDCAPSTPLRRFSVEYGDDTVVSSHYFPPDYDEEGFPVGDRCKAVITITQDQVVLDVYELYPNTEGGFWEWRPLNGGKSSLSISLSEFIKSRHYAVNFINLTKTGGDL